MNIPWTPMDRDDPRYDAWAAGATPEQLQYIADAQAQGRAVSYAPLAMALRLGWCGGLTSVDITEAQRKLHALLEIKGEGPTASPEG